MYPLPVYQKKNTNFSNDIREKMIIFNMNHFISSFFILLSASAPDNQSNQAKQVFVPYREKLFTLNADGVNIIVASRYKESNVYPIYSKEKKDVARRKNLYPSQLRFVFE